MEPSKHFPALCRAIAVAALAAAIVTAGSASGPASAHPHVFLDNRTTFVFEGEKLVALRLTWAFDELFGVAIIRQFDKNRNNRFEPDELKEVEQRAFSNLREFDYFTHVTLAGKPMPVPGVNGFKAEIVKGQLVYEFTVPLPAPVDPGASEVTAAIFDDSYFVAVSPDAKEPVRFAGMPAGKCKHTTHEAGGSLANFGIPPYPVVTLVCRKGT